MLNQTKCGMEVLKMIKCKYKIAILIIMKAAIKRILILMQTFYVNKIKKVLNFCKISHKKSCLNKIDSLFSISI